MGSEKETTTPGAPSIGGVKEREVAKENRKGKKGFLGGAAAAERRTAVSALEDVTRYNVKKAAYRQRGIKFHCTPTHVWQGEKRGACLCYSSTHAVFRRKK